MAQPLLEHPATMTTSVRPAIRFVRARARARGFTLTELGAVVVIIGILAVIAIVGYRKYMLSAKVTEAQQVISAIKIAQEDYKAESGRYADVGVGFCPGGAGVSNQKVQWNRNCNGGNMTWGTLPVHVQQPVQFSYRTIAGPNGTSGPPATLAAWTNWAGGDVTNPWFAIHAKCDLDGDPATETELVGSSFTNQIFTRNEGL